MKSYILSVLVLFTIALSTKAGIPADPTLRKIYTFDSFLEANLFCGEKAPFCLEIRHSGTHWKVTTAGLENAGDPKFPTPPGERG